MSVTLPPDVIERLGEWAEGRELSRSEATRMAVESMIDADGTESYAEAALERTRAALLEMKRAEIERHAERGKQREELFDIVIEQVDADLQEFELDDEAIEGDVGDEIDRIHAELFLERSAFSSTPFDYKAVGRDADEEIVKIRAKKLGITPKRLIRELDKRDRTFEEEMEVTISRSTPVSSDGDVQEPEVLP